MDINEIEFLMYFILNEKIKIGSRELIKTNDLVNYIKKISSKHKVPSRLLLFADDTYQVYFGKEYEDTEAEILDKISSIATENDYYFSLLHNNFIYFNISMSQDDIDDNLGKLTEYVSDEFAEKIANDISLYDLLGVDYRRSIILELVTKAKELQDLYSANMCDEKDSLTAYEILKKEREKIKNEIRYHKKLSTFQIAIYLDSLENYLEYEASLLFLNTLDNSRHIPYEIRSKKIVIEKDNDIYRNAFYDALFTREDISCTALRNRLEKDKLRTSLFKSDREKLKYWNKQKNLFIGILYYLREEIKSGKYDEEITDYLIEAMYRAMYVLDYVYDYNMFENDELESLKGIEPDASSVAYILIDDVLEYKDIELDYDSFGVKDYFKSKLKYVDIIIKKAIVKAYYNLSKDERIVTYIESNSNYRNENNTISRKILEGAIRSNSKKVRILKNKI